MPVYSAYVYGAQSILLHFMIFQLSLSLSLPLLLALSLCLREHNNKTQYGADIIFLHLYSSRATGLRA